MSGERNYISTVVVTTILVILLLFGISFIPPFNVGKKVVKRTNIFSDVMSFHDSVWSGLSSRDILDTSFLADISPELDLILSHPSVIVDGNMTFADSLKRIGSIEGHSVVSPEYMTETDTESDAPAALQTITGGDTPRNDKSVIIEDFSANGRMMTDFYRALIDESSSRVVRIAVLGDSFIESDIITGDMREQLQGRFGGRGVGFVPFSHPLAKYRSTINHTYEGWNDYGILNAKKIPADYKKDFFMSGIISIPQADVTPASHYKFTSFRKHISHASHASIYFRNQGESEMEVAINDTVKHHYVLSSSNDVQQITLSGDITKMDITLPKHDRFVGYGIVFEDSSGVSVHNFSVRGNSGLALFSTDKEVNTEMGKYMDYDLIIVQYGLNAMQADVTDYTYYGSQLKRVVEYVKLCCPGSAVLVMSVGDRCTKLNNRPVTMDAVPTMIAAQRNVAKSAGVAFWNTFDAMGGRNSMADFVAKGWAGKDYTHININGGKQIATKFVGSLLDMSESPKVVETHNAGEKGENDNVAFVGKAVRYKFYQ